MLKRSIAAFGLLSLLVLAPTKTTAQVAGVAIAALHDGSVFDGFLGPWRITPTGIDINYVVVCYSTADRRKAGVEVVVPIPDGTSLANMRTFATTAVVAACAANDIAVARGAVLLPAIQLGQ